MKVKALTLAVILLIGYVANASSSLPDRQLAGVYVPTTCDGVGYAELSLGGVVGDTFIINENFNGTERSDVVLTRVIPFKEQDPIIQQYNPKQLPISATQDFAVGEAPNDGAKTSGFAFVEFGAYFADYSTFTYETGNVTGDKTFIQNTVTISKVANGINIISTGDNGVPTLHCHLE